MIEMLRTFIEGISNLINSIWSFLTGIFEKIVDFLKIIPQAISYVTGLIDGIPTVYKIFGIAMILVLVIYIILGRESGG